MTRRCVRRLYRRASEAYTAGIHWHSGHKTAAPSGDDPCRIAFDAGLDAAANKRYTAMPLEVWTFVLAAWLKDGA